MSDTGREVHDIHAAGAATLRPIHIAERVEGDVIRARDRYGRCLEVLRIGIRFLCRPDNGLCFCLRVQRGSNRGNPRSLPSTSK